MTTGQLPFEWETPLAVAMKHKSETPLEPISLNPQIPYELNQLILKCIEKDRENRVQDTTDILKSLSLFKISLINKFFTIPTIKQECVC